MVATQFAVSHGAARRRRHDASRLSRVIHRWPGFETHGLVAATLDVDQIRTDPARLVALYDTILERLSAIPGVSAAGMTRDLPFGPAAISPALPPLARTPAVRRARQVHPARRVRRVRGCGGAARGSGGSGAAGENLSASWTAVSPSCFRTLGLTIREGRTFSDNEAARPAVAVIDETMARRWPNVSPLGRTFRINRAGSDPIQVIGVVASTRDPRDTSGGEPPRPAFYRPFQHHRSAHMTVILRTHGEAGGMFADVRRAVQAINPDLGNRRPPRWIRSWKLPPSSAGCRRRRSPRSACSGVLLSTVGLYGVIAYVVRSRAHELGIRLALGAQPADVRRLVLAQGFRIVGIGLSNRLRRDVRARRA